MYEFKLPKNLQHKVDSIKMRIQRLRVQKWKMVLANPSDVCTYCPQNNYREEVTYDMMAMQECLADMSAEIQEMEKHIQEVITDYFYNLENYDIPDCMDAEDAMLHYPDEYMTTPRMEKVMTRKADLW